MKARQIIILTTAVPFFALIAYFFLFRIGAGVGFSGPRDIKSEEYTIYGEDGTLLPLEITIPADRNVSHIVVVSADRGLDRSWNSRGITFHSGKYLAEVLASYGAAVVRYDQRGTGASMISGKNVPDFTNMSWDLKSVYKWATENIQTDGKTVLAGHGESCMTALSVATEIQPEPDQVLLISCAYSGTLLDNWGARLISNMKRAGVKSEILEFASSELKNWKQNYQFDGSAVNQGDRSSKSTDETEPADRENAGKSESVDGGDEPMSPDLIAFYRALEYMNTPDMYRWSRMARTVDFQALTRNILKKKIKISQIIGDADDEIPPEEIEAAETIAKALSTSYDALFSFHKIKGGDHFLQQRDSRSQTDISALFHRMNPFKEFSVDFIQSIMKEIGLSELK